MWPQPISLSGKHVQLVPLAHEHCDALKDAAADGDLHRLWYTAIPAPDGVDTEIARRLALQAEGSMLPFAVCTPDGTPVGMTTYMNIDPTNKRVEIGSTWYRKATQRSLLNTEAKRLLLGHAFDTLGCIAVEFRTHFVNHQSRSAIERLGAKQDGILRNHTVTGDGIFRDTVVYSIIHSEWPMVRQHLDWKLEMPRS